MNMIYRFFKKIGNWFFKDYENNGDDFSSLLELKYISRKNHNVSRNNISKNALKILYRLKKNGYKSYLVGGCIRDILLDIAPKDFDIVTDAKPDEIKRLFRNCRLIGRRFRIAHIYFGYEVVEVTTFRSTSNDTDKKNNNEYNKKSKNIRKHNEEGMIIRDNLYGRCIMQDAIRRDFTVNAIYYNIKDFSLIDYVDALTDIKNRQIKLIGDPVTRYREDPVRMLRAVRFACKLDFTIHIDTEKPLYKLGHLLQNVSAARLFEEFTKLFLSGYSLNTFLMLRKYDLLKYLLHQTEISLLQQKDDSFKNLIYLALENTDERIAVNKQTSISFLLGVLLWEPIREKSKKLAKDKNLSFNIFEEAINLIMQEFCKNITLPKSIVYSMKEIILLQIRLKNHRYGRKASHTFLHPKFRAGYDFLLLRAKNNEEEAIELVNWWDKYMHAGEKDRWLMAKELLKKKKKGKKKPKKTSN